MADGFVCWPQPGATYHANVGQRDEDVLIYLCAHSHQPNTDKAATLQCWTNLPSTSGQRDERTGWHAIDVGHWPSQSKLDWSVVAVSVPFALLIEAEKRGGKTEYDLTWRLVSDGQIQWLYSHGHDAIISFHLPQQKAVDHLIADLSLAEYEYIEKEKESALLSVQWNLSNDEDTASIKVIELKRTITGGLVWERTSSTWHTSRSLSDFNSISDVIGAGLIVLRFEDIDKVVVVLPVCSGVVNTILKRCNGTINAYYHRIGTTQKQEPHVIIAIGPTNELHHLIRKCFACVQRVDVPKESKSRQHPLSGSSGLGFCSWEALNTGEQRPSLSNLCNVLHAFEGQAAGSISTLLIDDGWQDVTMGNPSSRTLKSFDMDKSLIPHASNGNSLSHLQQHLTFIRRQFPNIDHIGVWMTLAGYWSGLDYHQFAGDYGPLLEARFRNSFWDEERNKSQTWWLPAADRIESFYDDYFSFLREAGVSFVKVDNQSDWEWIHSLVSSQGTPSDIAPSVYFDKAWYSMVSMAEKHFGSHSVIHSMALGHRFLTHLATQHHPIYFRNSDDTFPKVPDAHVWHIYHNALNACFSHGNPNIIPDADMITSFMPSESSANDDGRSDAKVDWADFHAAFRACFSQTKIWLSDCAEVSGRGAGKVSKRLLAPSKDTLSETSLGRLKTVQVGIRDDQDVITEVNLPLPRSIFANLTDNIVGPALKMSVSWQMKAGSSPFGGCLLSCWNTRYSSTSMDWIRLSDVIQALQEQDTEGLSHLFLHCPLSRKSYLLPCSCLDVQVERSRSEISSLPLFPIQLGTSCYNIFSIAPAISVERDGTTSTMVACLGLIDKYAGLTAVMDVCKGSQSATGGSLLTCRLSRAGNCAFVISGDVINSSDYSARIDGIDVLRMSIQTHQDDEDIVIVIVDMLQHLLSVKKFDHSSKLWQVDLVKKCNTATT